MLMFNYRNQYEIYFIFSALNQRKNLFFFQFISFYFDKFLHILIFQKQKENFTIHYFFFIK